VTNSGLARQHLINGYEHHAWNFYKKGRAESVEVCEEIKRIMNDYEGKILAELQTDNNLNACKEYLCCIRYSAKSCSAVISCLLLFHDFADLS
jgi:hypothetical protein